MISFHSYRLLLGYLLHHLFSSTARIQLLVQHLPDLAIFGGFNLSRKLQLPKNDLEVLYGRINQAIGRTRCRDEPWPPSSSPAKPLNNGSAETPSMISQPLQQKSKASLVIRQMHQELQNGIPTLGFQVHSPNFPGQILDLSSVAQLTHHPTSSDDDGIRQLLERNKPEQSVGSKEAASITRTCHKSKIGVSCAKLILRCSPAAELLIHSIYGRDPWRMGVEIAGRSFEVWGCSPVFLTFERTSFISGRSKCLQKGKLHPACNES